MRRASPTTTGETASGRSRSVFRSALPRKLWRTSTIAQMTPNTVFATTATAATSRVSHRACSAEGRVTASKTVPRPSSKVRAKTMPTGKASRRARYPNASVRRVNLAIMTGPPAIEQAHGEKNEQGDGEQQHRDRRGARGVVALDLPEDVDRSDLGFERYVARDEYDRAEFTHRAREAQGRPGEDRGLQVGQDDPQKSLELARPERDRCLLHVSVQLQQHRLYGPDDERERDEEQRHNHRYLGVGYVEAERALGPVQRQERQAGDYRR